MKRNVGSQLIVAQMISASDGSDQTSGTCNVAVEKDGVAGTGGTATHIANGKWEYAPIQGDTDGAFLTFQFVISGAITATIQTYTTFPQTVDNDVLAAGATGFAAIDTVVDAVLADTNELQTDDVPGLIATLDAVVDTVKAETALIVADTNELQTDDVPALISSLDAVVDTVKAETALIVADTNELQVDSAAGNLGVDVDKINGVTITGDGGITPFDV